MKDEKIKAILIQDGEPTPNNPVEIKRLLVNKEAEDYITNLQEENERLKQEQIGKYQTLKELQQENENKNNKILELQQELLNKKLNVKDIEYKEKMVYKSRNEKALKINKKLQNIGILDSRAVLWLSQQENILNGGDEE